MTRKKVLLPATMTDAGWQVARARADIEAIPFETGIAPAQFHALLADAAGVGLSMTPFGAAELKAAPHLQVVARHGVGYDAVDVAALTGARVPLMITGIANSPSVAEQALYLMLELVRRGAHFDRMVREQRWGDRMARPLPADLFGKTVLIIGFGRIGSRLARMCLALGMTVLCHDPYVPAAVIEGAGCAAAVSLDAALAQADFVSVNCPKTTQTTGLIGAARLALMKPGAFLVNTARGGIIDEPALHQALSGGALRGAGLDVFEREPPETSNPLFTLPNVILAPHMAGVTQEAMDRMGITMVRNVLSVLDGEPALDNVVNKEIYGHR